MEALVPPLGLRSRIHSFLADLLSRNPAATSSESYVQHHVEFALLEEPIDPRYLLRIGINYHGAKVQHLVYDSYGVLAGWNPGGEALQTGARAKMLLAGATIFPREPDEHTMSDCKIGGGDVPNGRYVRVEFKVRGWLGKTKNLDGAQLLKDLRLLQSGRADLLVMALSEVAHRKWRGEGPRHQVTRRTGCLDFEKILVDPGLLVGSRVFEQELDFEIESQVVQGLPPVPAQAWRTSTQRVIGASDSPMPGAEHFITLCWRATDA